MNIAWLDAMRPNEWVGRFVEGPFGVVRRKRQCGKLYDILLCLFEPSISDKYFFIFVCLRTCTACTELMRSVLRLYCEL